MELADADIDGILAKAGITLAERERGEFVESLNQLISAYFRDTLYNSLRAAPSKVVRRLKSIRRLIKNSSQEDALQFLQGWAESVEADDREARKAILRCLRSNTKQKVELTTAVDSAVNQYESKIARRKVGESETGRRRHKGDEAFINLLRDLAGLWPVQSGRYPSVGTDPCFTNNGTGPFIPFVRSVLEVMADIAPADIAAKLRKTDKAIARSISNHLPSAAQIASLF